MALRFLTAGESHGPQLTAILEGVPANLSLAPEDVDRHLARRQAGYGRGGRMQIERDRVRFLSGVRWGKTLGSPLTLQIVNRDWQNWDKRMSAEAADRIEGIAVTQPRPGHADLAGAIKYRQTDVRNILERSSARETAARVAVGGVCQALLASFGIRCGCYVRSIGAVSLAEEALPLAERCRLAEESECRTCEPAAEQRMKEAIDQARAAGDSLGGIVEVVAFGVPVGLGSHVHWDRRLDARLAAAVMGVQAFKGVEIGLGFEAARRPGSQVHDEIVSGATGLARSSNRAGGIEGGISNGEEIVIRGAMKPIPTLYRPLHTIDLATRKVVEASVERSDVCAVPAAAVVAEAAVAFELAAALLEKFGGDSLEETLANYQAYLAHVRSF